MTGAIRSMGGGNNVFRAIGFPEDKAQALLVRGDLAIQIRKDIGQLGIAQAQTAQCAGITQLRLNELLENRLDALVDIAVLLGS